MRRQPADYGVGVVGGDGVVGVALQGRGGVGDGEGCVGGLEQTDVVVAVSEDHEPAAVQFRALADECGDTALLAGGGGMDGQPVPARRVAALDGGGSAPLARVAGE